MLSKRDVGLLGLDKLGHSPSPGDHMLLGKGRDEWSGLEMCVTQVQGSRTLGAI